MTQHTLGPWEVRTGEFIKDSEGKAIAYCQSSNGTRNVDEVHANARLIAAAPEQQATIDRLEAERTTRVEALLSIATELEMGDYNPKSLADRARLVAKARP